MKGLSGERCPGGPHFRTQDYTLPLAAHRAITEVPRRVSTQVVAGQGYRARKRPAVMCWPAQERLLMLRPEPSACVSEISCATLFALQIRANTSARRPAARSHRAVQSTRRIYSSVRIPQLCRATTGQRYPLTRLSPSGCLCLASNFIGQGCEGREASVSRVYRLLCKHTDYNVPNRPIISSRAHHQYDTLGARL